jgi:hypothetical protein
VAFSAAPLRARALEGVLGLATIARTISAAVSGM